MKFYEFKVLPFGLSSAPYVFTKVMRQLVKFWRGCGLLALMYLDDGIGGNLSRESAKNIGVQVRKDLVSAGFWFFSFFLSLYSWGRAASSERTIAIFVFMFFGSFIFCARAQYDQGILDES